MPRAWAALSFYTLFSIAPILLVATWVAAARSRSRRTPTRIAQMQALMGDAGAAAVGALARRIGACRRRSGGDHRRRTSLLIGATSVFGELQRDLDRIWETPRTAATTTGGIWQVVHTRILSFGLILGVGFLLLVSLVVSAALAALSGWMQTFMTEWKALLFVVDIHPWSGYGDSAICDDLQVSAASIDCLGRRVDRCGSGCRVVRRGKGH